MWGAALSIAAPGSDALLEVLERHGLSLWEPTVSGKEEDKK